MLEILMLQYKVSTSDFPLTLHYGVNSVGSSNI